MNAAPFLLHHVSFRGSDGDFVMEARWHTAERLPQQAATLTFAIDDAQLVVGYDAGPGDRGRPYRPPVSRVLVLAAGKRGRFIVNARVPEESTTTYVQDTYNVALIDGSVPADLFTRGAPDRVRDVRVELY